MKNLFPLFLLSTTGAIAAQQDACAPTAPMCYTQDDCCNTYCLGPAQSIANAPVRPYTCNGDWEITVAGLYWKPHMDGLEYAVRDNVQPIIQLMDGQRFWNTLIDAKFENPHFKWDFGFKVGLGYNTTCDGWDLGATWTSFDGHASSHLEAEPDENVTLITLWSAFRSLSGQDNATDIETDWKLDLDLIDLELGCEYWASPRFSLRPFVGLRIGFIDQNYNLRHHGGAFGLIAGAGFNQLPQNNEVKMDLAFHGVGVRGGLDANWHLGCGFGIFGEIAPSILSGRFNLDHDETNRLTSSPFTKTKILDSHDSFRASRALLDLSLGIKWFSLFCDCKYGIGAKLSWDQYQFLHMNQFWRVKRNTPINLSSLNNLIQNVFDQRRGTLSIGGWTLTLQFDF